MSPFEQGSLLSEIEIFSQTDTSHCVNFVDSHVDYYVSNPFWNLYCNRLKSNDRVGASCILISTDGEKTMLTCRLELECTNNVAEYEASVQGLKNVLSMNV